MCSWEVEFFEQFEAEFDAYPEDVQDAIYQKTLLLEDYGPHLGRPYADTLEGSSYSNMKELRCKTQDGVWRVAFAFDPERKAVLLVAGDKTGISQRLFYKRLIALADERFDQHLSDLIG